MRVWVTVSSRLPLPLVIGLSINEQLPAQGEAALLAARRNQRDEQVFGGRKRQVKCRRAAFLLSFGARLEANTRNVNELDQRTASPAG